MWEHRHQRPDAPLPSHGIFHAFGIGLLLLTVVMAVWGPLWLALTSLLGAAVAWLAVATAGTEGASLHAGEKPARPHHQGRHRSR